MKGARAFAVALLSAAFLAAALFGTPGEALAQKKFLSIATGTTTGAYFALGGGLSKIVKEKMPGVELTVESTPGTVGNLRLLVAGKVDVAFGASDMVYYAVNGMEQFKDEGKEKYAKLRGLTSLYQEVIQVVCLADAPYQKLSDLKGKKVAVGAAGSGTMLAAKLMLQTAGLTFTDIKPDYLNMGDAANALADRNCDAGFFWSGLPTGALLDLSALNRIRIINLDDETMGKILKDWPFYAEYMVPAGTYRNLDAPSRCVASPGLLVVTTDMPEDLAYQLTKNLFENTETLKASHVRGGDIGLKTAFTAMPIRLHPGAAKYFKEKGLAIPEALLPK